MISTIKKYGQLAIIIILLVLIYFSRKDKVSLGSLNASIYVDEKICSTNSTIVTIDSSLNILISNNTLAADSSNMNTIRSMVDTIRNQIKDLKQMAVDISGGCKVKGNYYTAYNLGYNFGHKNKLTGDKGKDNGEGSRLKLNIDKLRELELSLITNETQKRIIEKLLTTASVQENNSDYIFSFEEQYFKLISTAGIINLLSNLETNVLLSKHLVIMNNLKNKN